MGESLAVLLPLLVALISFLVVFYLVRLAARLVRACERIAEAVEGPGFFGRLPQRVVRDAEGGA